MRTDETALNSFATTYSYVRIHSLWAEDKIYIPALEYDRCLGGNLMEEESFKEKTEMGNLVRINTQKIAEIIQLYENSWYGFLDKVPRLR